MTSVIQVTQKRRISDRLLSFRQLGSESPAPPPQSVLGAVPMPEGFEGPAPPPQGVLPKHIAVEMA